MRLGALEPFVVSRAVRLRVRLESSRSEVKDATESEIFLRRIGPIFSAAPRQEKGSSTFRKGH
jgi:hypothetical protein